MGAIAFNVLAAAGPVAANAAAGVAAKSVGTAPFWILAASVAVVVIAIVLLRLPAFFSLMLAGVVAGLMSAPAGTDPLGVITAVMTEFGNAAGKLGLTIALAAVIGGSLMASGAADRIVRSLVGAFGLSRAPLALLLSAFVLSAPVFVDTVMLLLFPLARVLSRRAGGSVVLYLLAVGAGALLSNGTIPPAPGPLIMADTLKLNLGLVLVAGLLFDIVPAASSLLASRWLSARVTPSGEAPADDEIAVVPESELPGIWPSAAPVALPFLLIALASLATVPALKAALPAGLLGVIRFAGDKVVALTIGAVVALVVQARQKKISWRKVGTAMGGPLETAGVIILIVSAGSAYGKMIERTGIGDAVRELAGGHGVNFILLGWALAAAMRVAQGSATVAVLTAMGIVASIGKVVGYSVHPLYIFLAIGYGSKFMPWMNDVSFWLFSRWGAMTPGETWKSWSVMSSLAAIVGLVEVIAAAWIWPHLPF